MRRLVLAVLGVLALAAGPLTHSAAPPAAATTIASPDLAFDLTPVSAADKTCADYDFFAPDQKDECNKSCKKGKTCVKKERCGNGPCPDPGYCWKCSN